MENKSEKEPIKVDASSKQLAGTLWRLSYPSMIAMGLQFVYDLVDMAWVGQISKTAISGVTLFTSIYVLFGILNEIAGASSVSMISQNYGRGDMEKTRRIAEQTISFKIVLAVLSGILLAFFLKPLLYFFLPDQAFFYSGNVFFVFGKYDFPLYGRRKNADAHYACFRRS